MIRILDRTGSVVAEGENIREIIKKLNAYSNENSKWKEIYRFSGGVIDAYLVKDGEFDHAGQEANEIYTVIDVD